MANEAKGTKIIGARSLEEMVSKLKKPRRVMLLVKAGAAVDAFIDTLVRAGNTSILRPLYWHVTSNLPMCSVNNHTELSINCKVNRGQLLYILIVSVERETFKESKWHF